MVADRALYLALRVELGDTSEGVEDADAFRRRLVEAGRRRGFEFTVEVVAAAEVAARRDWMLRAV